MKFYIAFSIHGTNKFTVATCDKPAKSPILEMPDSTIKDLFGPEFSIARSRRPDYNIKTDGVKLHWSKLLRKDGTPIQDKGWVTKRFNQLVKRGWIVVSPKVLNKGD